MMEAQKQKNMPYLQIKGATWFKDSHSLFDYESNKIENYHNYFPINTSAVVVYRKRQSNSFVTQPLQSLPSISNQPKVLI